MRDFASHQEAQRFLDAGIVGGIDQPLVDDLGATFGGDVGAQIAGRIAARIDIGRGPGNAGRIGQRGAAAIENRLGMAAAALIKRHIHVGLLQRAFGHLRLGALVQHGDDRADDFEMAQFLGGDVEQQILAARVGFAQPLREIAHGGGELAVGPAELFQQEGGEHGIGLGDPHGVLQALVVHEHIGSPRHPGAAHRSRRDGRARLQPLCGS